MPGPLGCGAFTYIILLLECPGEILATQRAFLLLHQEEASGSHEGMATSIDDLMTSQSTEGKDFPDFEMQDAKIASALRRIISSTSFRRRVSVEEQRAQGQKRFLKRRLLMKSASSTASGSGLQSAKRPVTDTKPRMQTGDPLETATGESATLPEQRQQTPDEELL